MTAAGGSTYANMTEFVIGQGFDDSTVESMQILHGYGHHLTPAFLVHNHLHWEPSTSGALLGGIYDTTQVPWRRLGYSEFAGKMQASGFMPKMVFASGLGR
jgi:hypothetical protein